MKPTPVLYVHSSADLYGSDQMLLQMASDLDKTRFEPLLVLPEAGPLVTAIQKMGLDVYIKPLSVLHRTLSVPYWLRFGINLLWSTRALRGLIKTRGVQLVHTNTSHVFNGGLAARAAGVPHIWHVRELHTGRGRLGALISRLIYATSDAVISVSTPVQQAFFGWRGPDPKLHIVYDGIDTQRFTPHNDGAAVRAELGLNARSPLVGMVGRITPWKGHKLFLQAAAQVRQRLPQAHFVIVGDAVTSGDQQFKQSLLQLTQQLGLEAAVTFSGVRSDIPQVMAALDVFVLPSEWPEPWGLVVLEAMAAGRPVVATRQGGPLETVCDGETGYLVLPDSAEPMAAAILTLLQMPQRARAMGQAGRARCEAHFTRQHSAQAITELYKQVLGGDGVGSKK